MPKHLTKNRGLTACRSKSNKEAKLVERKVCFILEAGNLECAGVGGGECGAPMWILDCACLTGKTCLRPAMPVAAPVPSPASRHRRVYSDEGGKLSPFLPPEIFQKLQVVESQSSKK